MLERIKHFLFTRKLELLLGVVVGSICLWGGDIAWAAETAENTSSKALEGFATLATLLIKVVTFLAFLLMSVGGKLMTTDYLLDTHSQEAIRSMWVIIRNFTNIGFVLILLFLAFSNLFSNMFGQGGNWTIKEKLPKIIFGLVAINFSLLGFRVLIEAVQVGTEALLSISDYTREAKGLNSLAQIMERPYDYQGGKCVQTSSNGPNSDAKQKDKCLKFYEWVNSATCPKGVNKSGCYFYVDHEFWESRLDKETNNSVINVFLTFGSFFQHFERLPALAANANSWTQVVDNVLFSLIMGLAFIVAMIALFIVLLARLVVLWILMVFSPLIVAAMVMGFSASQQITEKIVTYLLIPLKFAAALAVTMVMLMVQIDYMPTEAENMIKLGPALAQFGGTTYSILWQIATIVIFWKTVFWAIEGTEAQFIVDKVRTGAETVGSFAARAVTVDRPMIPVPGAKSDVSLSTLAKFPDVLRTERENKLLEERQQLRRAIGGGSEMTKLQEDTIKAINNLGNTLSQDNLVQFLKNNGTRGLRNNDEAQDKIINKLRAGKVKFNEDALREAFNEDDIEVQKDKIAQAVNGVSRTSLDEVGAEASTTTRSRGSTDDAHERTEMTDKEGKTIFKYDLNQLQNITNITDEEIKNDQEEAEKSMRELAYLAGITEDMKRVIASKMGVNELIDKLNTHLSLSDVKLSDRPELKKLFEKVVKDLHAEERKKRGN